MKGIMRYFCALIAVICLTMSAMTALLCCVTTEGFAREVGNTQALRTLQNQRIEAEMANLTANWQLHSSTLQPWGENAALHHCEAVAKWWGDLWQDEHADQTPPAYLDSAAESALVTAIRADAGFIAITDENQRRAIARDEVAYALDTAVCDTVFPLRRSLTEIGLNLLSDVAPLPTLRSLALTGAAVLAGLGLMFILLARKAAGSTLIATSLAMAFTSLPVWLADIPGMLAPLSDIALVQGRNALTILALMWYGAAAVIGAAGCVVLAIKKQLRRNAA